MDCELCRRKADPADPLYRWNGPGRSHCNHCHDDWRLGSIAMHCVTCHTTFGSPAACDDHQGEGYCIPPDAIGLVGRVNQWDTVVYRRVVETAPL